MTPEERTARRAMIKAHHPDRGGDPARFVELLAAIDRTYDGAPGPARDGRPSGHGRRRRRQAVRRLRQRLPRHVPGARRYATY